MSNVKYCQPCFCYYYYYNRPTYQTSIKHCLYLVFLLVNTVMFWATVCKTVRHRYRTVVLSVLYCPVCLFVCNVGVLWPNGWMDQDAASTEIGIRPFDIVLDEDPAPFPTERGTVHLCGFRHISTSGLGVDTSRASFIAIFTARRNARIASAVLASAISSVCLSVCPSVTCRYCVKTTARSTVLFALSDCKMCLVLEKLKNIPQERPLPSEILAQSHLLPPDSSES